MPPKSLKSKPASGPKKSIKGGKSGMRSGKVSGKQGGSVQDFAPALVQGLCAHPEVKATVSKGSTPECQELKKLCDQVEQGQKPDCSKLIEMCKASTPQEFTKKLCEQLKGCCDGVMLAQGLCGSCKAPLASKQKIPCSCIEVPYVCKGEWDPNMELLTADVLAKYFHGTPEGQSTCKKCKKECPVNMVRTMETLPKCPVIVFVQKGQEPEEITVGDELIWKLDGGENPFQLCAAICMQGGSYPCTYMKDGTWQSCTNGYYLLFKSVPPLRSLVG